MEAGTGVLISGSGVLELSGVMSGIKIPVEASNDLREAQSQFAGILPILMLYIGSTGLKMTLGDAWAREGHMKRSLHYVRLAIDINLFRDGVYLKDTEDYRKAGEFWEALGGSWGGRWGDGDHFSLAWGGRK